MRLSLAAIGIVLAFSALSADVAVANELEAWPPLQRVRTIVIDPGHGGEDSGTVAADGLQEKEITLQYALALRDALLKTDPDLEVILTRDSDRTLRLEERTQTANGAAADLFISIHFNSAPRLEAHGIETFYLAPAGTVPGQTVPGQGVDAIVRTSVGVGGDVAAIVLQDAARRGSQHASAHFAELVHESMISATGAVDREVRAGQFRVLRGLHMPGIVLEVGFLSNPQETKRVRCEEYMQTSVAAIVRSVQEWDHWVLASTSGWRPAEGHYAGGVP